MTLKTVEIDGAQYAVLQDGKPILVDGDQEIVFDVLGTHSTIKRLNGEAKGHRERAEAAEKIAKAFEGLDAAEVRKAMELQSNLDAKKLIDAGEVEKVKSEITKGFQAQLEEAVNRANSLEQQLYGEKIGGSFSRSEFIAKNLAIPADLVQAKFGSQFKVEDGRVVAYDQHGQKIYSRSNPGELAEFNEALEVLINSYPHKDSILKASGMQGSGSPTGGAKSGGKKSVTRDQFESMSPHERAKVATSGVEIVD